MILDEPTSGLDPNQLIEIRRLIKELGEEKTVIFSTHIMQEVQALCDRVIIINKGEMVANDTIETLQQKVTGETVITVEFAQKIEQTTFNKIKQIKTIKALGNSRWQLIAEKNKDLRADIFNFAVSNNLTLLEMKKEQYSVEDVFQELTK